MTYLQFFLRFHQAADFTNDFTAGCPGCYLIYSNSFSICVENVKTFQNFFHRIFKGVAFLKQLPHKRIIIHLISNLRLVLRKSFVFKYLINIDASWKNRLENGLFYRQQTSTDSVIPLKLISANPAKWPNTLKQFTDCCR